MKPLLTFVFAFISFIAFGQDYHSGRNDLMDLKTIKKSSRQSIGTTRTSQKTAITIPYQHRINPYYSRTAAIISDYATNDYHWNRIRRDKGASHLNNRTSSGKYQSISTLTLKKEKIE